MAPTPLPEIDALCARLNISCAELARWLGVTRPMLARWRHGQTKPRDSAAALLRALVWLQDQERLLEAWREEALLNRELELVEPGEPREHLQRLQADAGLSQAGIAAVLGVHRNTVAAWLLGQRDMPAVSAHLVRLLHWMRRRGLFEVWCRAAIPQSPGFRI